MRALTRLSPSLRRARLDTRYGPMVCDLGESVCYPLLKYGGYPHTTIEEAFLLSIVDERSVVLDIGANIGVTARLFADKAKHVHAVEPSPRARTLLKANIANLPNVVLHEVALSDREGSVAFAEESGLDLSHIAEEGAVIVKAVRADSLPMPAPDVVKVDVEGHEQAVFRGMTRILQGGPIVLFEALTENDRAEIEAIIGAANPRYRFRRLDDVSRNFIAQIA